jgi:hypothetical protein
MLTLPGDAVRQIQWRFADRFDLQMLVQSARGVARGTVARLVAAGERNTHEWTPARSGRDDGGLRPRRHHRGLHGAGRGRIHRPGPKNLALGWRPLSWPGWTAARPRPAWPGFLALSPIHERGTAGAGQPLQEAGRSAAARRGPQALARRLRADRAHPYVGVDTGMLSGKVRVAEWKDGEEPWLQVDKRGRFITNIAFANFVTAAVNSDDRASRAVAW